MAPGNSDIRNGTKATKKLAEEFLSHIWVQVLGDMSKEDGRRIML